MSVIHSCIFDQPVRSAVACEIRNHAEGATGNKIVVVKNAKVLEVWAGLGEGADLLDGVWL